MAINRQEIANYREQLRTILKNEDEGKQLKDLELLAKEVGAGYVNTKIVGANTTKQGDETLTVTLQNSISAAELVVNINNALQTDTMIDMGNIAAKNFWIAVIASIAAVVSAIAAWAAVAQIVAK